MRRCGNLQQVANGRIFTGVNDGPECTPSATTLPNSVVGTLAG